jgi:hypothetical protein
MTSKEQEDPKANPRLSIPVWAIAILPLHNIGALPATVMPWLLHVRRASER